MIPGALLMGFAIWIFGEGYAPSPTTLQYLYSSVFQGLAALVAVSLAIVAYVSDRLEKLMEVHLADARRIFNQFEDVDPVVLPSVGYDLMVERIGKWYAAKVEPNIESLKRSFAPYMNRSSNSRAASESKLESSGMKPFIDDFLRLQSYEGSLRIYDDSASNLGRFQQALMRRLRLPNDAVLAFAWAIATIMLAIVLLATVDSGGIPSSWATTIVSSTLLAVVYMGLLFRTLLGAYFGGGRIRGFEETLMPDSEEAWKLIKEVRQFLADSTDYHPS
jgi:hypothetical protein